MQDSEGLPERLTLDPDGVRDLRVVIEEFEDKEEQAGESQDDRPMDPATVLGYGLRPAAYPGMVTVCRACLSDEQAARFVELASEDALEGITFADTWSEADPEYCDSCGTAIHSGNPQDEEEDDEWDEDDEESIYETGPQADGFGRVYSDADPGC